MNNFEECKGEDGLIEFYEVFINTGEIKKLKMTSYDYEKIYNKTMYFETKEVATKFLQEQLLKTIENSLKRIGLEKENIKKFTIILKKIEKQNSPKDCKICNVENCNNKATRKGMCDKHSSRIYRNGDLKLRKTGCKKQTQKQPDKYCTVENCDNKYFSKGLCNKHYARFKRHGDPHILKQKGKQKN